MVFPGSRCSKHTHTNIYFSAYRKMCSQGAAIQITIDCWFAGRARLIGLKPHALHPLLSLAISYQVAWQSTFCCFLHTTNFTLRATAITSYSTYTYYCLNHTAPTYETRLFLSLQYLTRITDSKGSRRSIGQSKSRGLYRIEVTLHAYFGTHT